VTLRDLARHWDAVTLDPTGSWCEHVPCKLTQHTPMWTQFYLCPPILICTVLDNAVGGRGEILTNSYDFHKWRLHLRNALHYIRLLTRKTNIIKQDIEVEGKSYEAVNQFIYLGSQINSKNSIQEEIRAGNRSLFANKNS